LLEQIRLVAFDFDGVFTDNRVMVSQDGHESVVCWRSDGIGLSRVAKVGVEAVIVSCEDNPVVAARASKLGLACYAGCDRKLDVLIALLRERGVSDMHAAFVGNDTPDLECMRHVGVAIAVADAYPEVKEAAHFVTTLPGGFGAVREVCDWIAMAKEQA